MRKSIRLEIEMYNKMIVFSPFAELLLCLMKQKMICDV